LKECSDDIFTPFLTTSINDTFQSANFPDNLKLADVTPIYKKGSKSEKSNFRSNKYSTCVVFERIIHDQLSSFFDILFNKQQYDYRKGFSTQLFLSYHRHGGSWLAHDQNKFFAALLMISL